MPRQNVMVVAGVSAAAAAAGVGLSSTGLVATGSTQAGALVLPADVNKFTTVAAGTGCIIPPLNGGDNIVVVNSGANALLLYPPVGSTINALSANTGYSIATATPYCQITCVDPTHYHCFQSA